ncbi:hypothetical protein [Romboutsia lituseburensis]|nr:hypothetical protein [Romboutsia lituseburensis]MCR8744092.1 hypothetical protein [Romboutsia lituseburensis]
MDQLYLYNKCRKKGLSISHELIEVILNFEEQFLDSKGLIEVEEYEYIY